MRKSRWSLYENGKVLKPLVFSNGKSQEDVVNEVLKAINGGHKLIFIRGVCGTGKSAIALNIVKELGKASVVVPVKTLQKQYEDDYTSKKYLLKENGQKLKISVITGRSNHLCPYLQEQENLRELIKKEQNFKLTHFFEKLKKQENKEGYENYKNYNNYEKNKSISCDNPFLPCKIEIKEKNIKKIKEYLKKNPKIDSDDFNSISQVRRMSIAPICPYWSPVVSSEINYSILGDAHIKNYMGLDNKIYKIYNRKKGCGFYNQYLAYIDSDVIIFNSRIYQLETLMDRKLATDIEIIDECDEFLDNFSNSKKINVNRLNLSLGGLFAENKKIQKIIQELIDLTNDILKDKKIEEHISSNEIVPIKNTKILNLLKSFLDHDLMNVVECDEENYCHKVSNVAKTFSDFFNETYLSFYKEKGYQENKEIIIELVTTNLEKRFKELIDKNKILVLMSGTIHSEDVLRNIFGLKDFKIIEAETKTPGKITPLKTGFEINCKYDNFRKGIIRRGQYLDVLSKCIEKAIKPVLIHVNAYRDLPTKQEAKQYNLKIMTQEELRELQLNDKVGRRVKKFKSGQIKYLFSTVCNRGVDFPGQTCNSIILTKYPYPNINSIFWKVLRKTNPRHYHSFYMDKARREFLQRKYRGLRSEKDHIFLLSPDSRIFDFNHFKIS